MGEGTWTSAVGQVGQAHFLGGGGRGGVSCSAGGLYQAKQLPVLNRELPTGTEITERQDHHQKDLFVGDRESTAHRHGLDNAGGGFINTHTRTEGGLDTPGLPPPPPGPQGPSLPLPHGRRHHPS